MNYIFDKIDTITSSIPTKQWEKASDKILLHTRGKGLAELLHKYRPNEPKDITEYRTNNSYLYTRDSFIKAIDAFKKSVRSVGLSYDVQEELEQVLANKRINTPLGTYSIVQYLISIFQEVVEYPNAHLVWLPTNPDLNAEYNPPNHPMGVEGFNVQLDFEPYIAKDVLYFDAHCTIWCHGKWKFRHNGKVQSAKYYMGVDPSGFYRYIPIGYKNGKLKYVTEEYYVPDNGLGFRPTRPLGGDLSSVEVMGEDFQYFESYLANAAEYGKDFLSSYSDAKAVQIKNAYPLRVFNESICGSCNGQGYRTIKGVDHTCSDCNGSGKMFTTSPYGDIQRKPTGRRDDNGKSTPFVEYYSSGSELLEFNMNHCFNTLLPKVDDALCLNYVRTAQSGTAKEEDKECYYALMEKIVGNYIEMLEFSLKAIQNIIIYDKADHRRVRVYSIRSVRSANTFDFIKEVSQLNSSTLPSQMKSAITKQYLADIKSDIERKTLGVILEHDVLYGKTEADILNLSAAIDSPITKEDMEFHLRGIVTLNELAQKYGDDYVRKTNSELYDEVIQIINPKAIDESDIDAVVETKIDIEAEAKAKLKGTVGGVQGIISINQAVAQGQMTEASAEKLLQEIYGFTPEVASALIEKVPNGEIRTTEG